MSVPNSSGSEEEYLSDENTGEHQNAAPEYMDGYAAAEAEESYVDDEEDSVMDESALGNEETDVLSQERRFYLQLADTIDKVNSSLEHANEQLEKLGSAVDKTNSLIDTWLSLWVGVSKMSMNREKHLPVIEEEPEMQMHRSYGERSNDPPLRRKALSTSRAAPYGRLGHTAKTQHSYTGPSRGRSASVRPGGAPPLGRTTRSQTLRSKTVSVGYGQRARW